MGATVLTESVLEHLRPGDTLIVSIEPGLLTAPLDQTALGVQFSFAVRHPNWVLNPVLGVGRLIGSKPPHCYVRALITRSPCWARSRADSRCTHTRCLSIVPAAGHKPRTERPWTGPLDTTFDCPLTVGPCCKHCALGVTGAKCEWPMRSRGVMCPRRCTVSRKKTFNSSSKWRSISRFSRIRAWVPIRCRSTFPTARCIRTRQARTCIRTNWPGRSRIGTAGQPKNCDLWKPRLEAGGQIILNEHPCRIMLRGYMNFIRSCQPVRLRCHRCMNRGGRLRKSRASWG